MRPLCLLLLLIFGWPALAPGLPSPQAGTFRVEVVRKRVNGDLVTGDLFVNGRLIGNTYENNRLKIPAGQYQGLIRYVSGRNFVAGPFGQLARTGDFLLEVAGVTGRTNILFHGGNQAYQSQGCILLGAVNRDPITGGGSMGPDHPLRVMRRMFYGTETPNSTPNLNITITVSEPEQRWRSNPAATSVRFGGAPYCSYQTDLSNITLELATRGDRDVVSATARVMCVERALSRCPTPVIPPNQHEYVLSGATFQNGTLNANFRPTGRFGPGCLASFTGRVVNGSLQGTFTIRRTDIGAPLAWTATVNLTLTRQ